jgi:hypothetical protein
MTRLCRALTVALLALSLTLGLGHALAPGYHTAGGLEWCEHCP